MILIALVSKNEAKFGIIYQKIGDNTKYKLMNGFISLEKRQRFLESNKTKKQVSLTFITNLKVVQNEYAMEMADVGVRGKNILGM